MSEAAGPDPALSPAKPAPAKNQMIIGDPAVFAGRDFGAIDRRAAVAPKEAMSSMKKLVSYLTADATSDVERARALWIWEATHVEYDGKRYSVGDIENLDPEQVFIRRKGVCQDYASLFERLAMIAGLQAPVIRGLATGYPDSILLGDTRHAWNAVRIDRAWYLLDVTWSAGYLDDDFSFHYTRPDERYFLAPPAVFVQSHFPHDMFWQLLSRPITLSQFLDMAGRK
jgi:transglutaminase/protease-like cytokinesis protein 3